MLSGFRLGGRYLQGRKEVPCKTDREPLRQKRAMDPIIIYILGGFWF